MAKGPQVVGLGVGDGAASGIHGYSAFNDAIREQFTQRGSLADARKCNLGLHRDASQYSSAISRIWAEMKKATGVNQWL